jgi:RND family efflux transporter MFP subunit
MYRLGFLIPVLMLLPFSGLAQDSLIIEPAKKEIALSGYTRSIKDATLSSEVSGRILTINYDVGDAVEDKPFIEIDSTFIDFQIAGVRQSLGKMKISSQQSRSRVAYLQKEFKRIEELFKNESTPEVKRDAAAEELTQARLAHDAIEQEYAVLEISLKELQEKKKRHTIFAPKGWMVVAKMAEVGEVIGPQTPLARVADYRDMVVPLSVSGEELAAIRDLGREFDALLEDKQVRVRLNWVNPEFDEGTRKLGIELLIDRYQGNHRGGLRFSLPILLKSQGLAIPREAVIKQYENPRIVLKNSGEVINVIIVGETKGQFVIADDDRLDAGMELEPASRKTK